MAYRFSVVVALGCVGVLLCASAAQADIIRLRATLTNNAETPPAVPTDGPGAGGAPRASSGFANFVLDTAVPMMTMTATITGIDIGGMQTPGIANDNLINAHIHSGPNDPNVTTNPVTWGFFGAPDNDGPSTASTTRGHAGRHRCGRNVHEHMGRAGR